MTLTDAGADGSVTLEHVWFNGEARSLLGPIKGEGAANVGGDLYPFRLSAGRLSDDGKLKLRVNVDPVNHPLSAEADGMVSVNNGAPSFDGTLNLRRPVGIATGGRALSQPWHLGGKIKATSSSALMQNVEFQYGSQDKGFKLTGVADLKFGKQPRFDGVLSADQIDLDRALGEADGSRLPPATALRKLAQLAGGAFRPTMPIKIGIGIDQATLGGDTVQNLRGDISTDAKGWNLDRFEFRAPGYTQARVSGHLAVDDEHVAFAGPAEIKTSDPKALTAWLEGRAPPAQSELRPMSLRGELTLASDKIAVDRLSAEFDRKAITGNFAYVLRRRRAPGAARCRAHGARARYRRRARFRQGAAGRLRHRAAARHDDCRRHRPRHHCRPRRARRQRAAQGRRRRPADRPALGRRSRRRRIFGERPHRSRRRRHREASTSILTPEI